MLKDEFNKHITEFGGIWFVQLPSVGILLELHRNGHVAIQVKKGGPMEKVKRSFTR